MRDLHKGRVESLDDSTGRLGLSSAPNVLLAGAVASRAPRPGEIRTAPTPWTLDQRSLNLCVLRRVGVQAVAVIGLDHRLIPIGRPVRIDGSAPLPRERQIGV